MSKPWWGRIIFSGEGIETEREFKTESEARAYAIGFEDAKNMVQNCDEDILDDYYASHSNQESVDE